MVVTLILSMKGSIMSASNSGLYRIVLAIPKINLELLPQPFGKQISLTSIVLSAIMEHLSI